MGEDKLPKRLVYYETTAQTTEIVNCGRQQIQHYLKDLQKRPDCSASLKYG
jgi:hypothetical protein